MGNNNTNIELLNQNANIDHTSINEIIELVNEQNVHIRLLQNMILEHNETIPHLVNDNEILRSNMERLGRVMLNLNQQVGEFRNNIGQNAAA